MKRIKLEVLVENKDASEAFKGLKEAKTGGIIEYTLSMEDVEMHNG